MSPDPAEVSASVDVADDFPESEWSLSVQRVMTLPRPKWRGVSHRVAFPISVIATVWFAVTRADAKAMLVAFIFGFGLTFMYGASALVHIKRWKPRQYQWLFQLDHTGIYLTTACTTTPIAVYALHGRQQAVMLSIMWAGSIMGIIIDWLPGNPPKGVVNAMFLCLGWTPLLMGKWLVEGLGGTGLTLLLVGGAFYTIGAFIVGSMWPNPDPEVFGYHEIWHLFVIIGATLHWVLAWRLVP